MHPRWLTDSNSRGIFPRWLLGSTVIIEHPDGVLTIYPKLVNSFTINAIFSELALMPKGTKFYLVKGNACKEIKFTFNEFTITNARRQTWKILNLLR